MVHSVRNDLARGRCCGQRFYFFEEGNSLAGIYSHSPREPHLFDRCCATSSLTKERGSFRRVIEGTGISGKKFTGEEE